MLKVKSTLECVKRKKYTQSARYRCGCKMKPRAVFYRNRKRKGWSVFWCCTPGRRKRPSSFDKRKRVAAGERERGDAEMGEIGKEEEKVNASRSCHTRRTANRPLNSYADEASAEIFAPFTLLLRFSSPTPSLIPSSFPALQGGRRTTAATLLDCPAHNLALPPLKPCPLMMHSIQGGLVQQSR